MSSLPTPTPPVAYQIPDLNTSGFETGWSILKCVLEAARDGSDLFLPLKAALVGVTAIMAHVEVGGFC